jgi:hypothetical protein
MIEDMTIRKFAPRTQEGHIPAVKGFQLLLRRLADQASFKDLRRNQLHLAASGAGTPTINHTVAALRFLFIVTQRKLQVVIRLPFIREPRKLPIVPSLEEVAPGEPICLTAVLHSWGSALTHHPQVHIIVPGRGISLDGERWISCRPCIGTENFAMRHDDSERSSGSERASSGLGQIAQFLP